MYDVFIGYDENNRELWVDYEWLHKGCVDEQHFNWFYSLFTAQNPDIRQLQIDGTQFRKFISSAAYSDWVSHERKWELVDVTKYRNPYMENYIKQTWGI